MPRPGMMVLRWDGVKISSNGLQRSAVPYYVYLLASQRHGTLYLGVTGDLVRRVDQHKTKAPPGFTARYGVDRLVWFEVYDDPTAAITHEKAVKKSRRDWKIRLIDEQNPEWRDLFPAIVG
ncbi:MAG: GIY-YIG nuclease family protein [Stellaceae bacterium]